MDDGVGPKLRDARTRRKTTIEEVEAATKIRGRYLRAIENGEWELLPGDAYARAFVRAYAVHLGLDGERLAEEYRRECGVARPGERLLGSEPPRARRPRARPEGGRRVPPGLLAAAVSAALIALLVAIGLSGGSEQPSGGAGAAGGHRAPAQASPPARGEGEDEAEAVAVSRGLSLSLTATAEVWVCLLDGKGEELVDGLILAEGAQEGPYRSGSFTVSLGNGEVEMTVNGEQASIPATSSPIGLEVGADGSLRRLAEGERPTCT